MKKFVFYNGLPITLDECGFKSLNKAVKVIKAGGGLVKNAEGKFLLIFRQGYWDLPKGKLDLGETIEACALREVREETGISELLMVKKLPKTYHLYVNQEQEIILKKCYWFELYSEDHSCLKPQQDEDITEAVWLSRKDVEERMNLMFPTIRQCFEQYFATHKPTIWQRLFGG